MTNHTFEILNVNQIIEILKENANTIQAKEKIAQIQPSLKETELHKNLNDTSQAKQLLEKTGTPPIPFMEHIEEYIGSTVKGELLTPEQIEEIGGFLVAVKRLKVYLDRGKEQQVGLAFYSDNLFLHDELYTEIERSIRSGRIDDYATRSLRDIRRQLQRLDEKIREKAESIIRANKTYVSDSYVVSRGGRVCIPVKKQYAYQVAGAQIDKSSTGSTVFIEPAAVTKLRDEYELLKIEEDSEERMILYTLMNMIAEKEVEIRENIRVVVMLDFVFAKGKMSIQMQGIEPKLNFERRIKLKEARHPLIERDECVPIDFQVGDGSRGVVITGPNTGGKTVTIKTVALLSTMACMGLHVPAKEADIAANSQVLCDIGDGQNISDNLSTFSAHIKNVIGILKKANEESLIVLDELGSGTDPAEGMGIAVAILEQLRQSKALFLVTTHYPEVKEYADKYPEIINARMAFDRESLRPLYRLEMGKAGESCALYIAKRLGVPNEVLKFAAREAYGSSADQLIGDLELNHNDGGLKKERSPRIQKKPVPHSSQFHEAKFSRGDSVFVLQEEKIGIVVKPDDEQSNVLVQIQKEKKLINHKRLKLKVAAAELYPEDYDFSIIFDTVENRKARHKMGKRHQEDMVIYSEADECF